MQLAFVLESDKPSSAALDISPMLKVVPLLATLLPLAYYTPPLHQPSGLVIAIKQSDSLGTGEVRGRA